MEGFRVILTKLIYVIVILLLSVPLIGRSQLVVHAAPNAPQGAQVVYLNMNTTIQPNYDIVSLSEPETVTGTISGTNLMINNITTLDILTSFHPYYQVVAKVNSTTVTSFANQTFSGVYATFYRTIFTLPIGNVSFTIHFGGVQSGNSVLYRYVVTVPSAYISSSSLTFINNYDLIIPTRTVISGSFDQFGNSLPKPMFVSRLDGGAYDVYSLNPNIQNMILVSPSFGRISLIVLSVGLIIIVIAVLSASTRVNQRIFGPVLNRFSALYSINTLNGTPRERRSFVTYLVSLRGFVRSMAKPRNLLVLFILTGFLMTSLGALAGPDPQYRAYVIADPSIVRQISSSLQSTIGPTQIITPAQDYSDFGVMSSVNTFNVVVISRYSATSLPEVAQFVTPNLVNVPIIIVDSYANPSYVNLLKALYPNQVISVQNAASLAQNETLLIQQYLSSSSNQRPNPLGIQISQRDFEILAVIEAALSFLLILFGWAFLGSRFAESNTENTLMKFATFVALGVFVFVFSETVYVETSILLSFPLSLHAVISGATSITATGLLGVALHLPLGGGSTPRLLAGFLGVLIGAYYAPSSYRFSKKSIAIVIGLGLFVLASPFAIGNFAFEFLLLFVGNVSVGTAFYASLLVKGFIYGVGSVFGGSPNPFYLMSAGKMLYFAGLAPMAFIKKMGRITSTLALLMAALFVGDGGVRVGEMTPQKTLIAIMPGIATGIAFTLVLLGIAVLERYLSSRYMRTRS